MFIKAKDLKVGQTFRYPGFPWETVAEIQEFESGVMVYLAGQESNPFVSSTFASFGLNTLVQVS